MHVGGEEEHTAVDQCRYHAEESQNKGGDSPVKQGGRHCATVGGNKGAWISSSRVLQPGQNYKMKKSRKVMEKDTVAKITVN